MKCHASLSKLKGFRSRLLARLIEFISSEWLVKATRRMDVQWYFKPGQVTMFKATKLWHFTTILLLWSVTLYGVFTAKVSLFNLKAPLPLFYISFDLIRPSLHTSIFLIQARPHSLSELLWKLLLRFCSHAFSILPIDCLYQRWVSWYRFRFLIEFLKLLLDLNKRLLELLNCRIRLRLRRLLLLILWLVIIVSYYSFFRNVNLRLVISWCLLSQLHLSKLKVLIILTRIAT